MQIKTKHLLTMLVMAGISAVSFPAKAATSLTGDLFLYFRASSGAGSSTTTVVNLGSASTLFRDATSTFTHSQNLGTLLSSTYNDGGTNWYDRSNLFWGVAGSNSNVDASGLSAGDPFRTAYLSKAQSGTITLGTQNSAAPVVGSSDADGLALKLNGELRPRYRNEGTGSNITGTGPLSLATSITNTWEEYNNGSTSFSLPFSVEGTFANGASGAVLDLYRVLAIGGTNGLTGVSTPNNASFEGTFSISQAGAVTFNTPAAVPEPSRALFAGLGLGALLLRRRRKA